MHNTTPWLVFGIHYRGRSSGANKEPTAELSWFGLGCVSCWWPQGAVNMARTRQGFLVHALFSLTGHHGHGQIFLKRTANQWTHGDWINKDYWRSAKSQVLGMKFAFLTPVNSLFYPETAVQCSNTASLLLQDLIRSQQFGLTSFWSRRKAAEKYPEGRDTQWAYFP